MDNKALANFVKVELSKLTTAINKLTLKLSAPWEQDKASISPQQNASDKAHNTPGESLIVPPAPTHTDNPKYPARNPPPRRTLRRRCWRWIKRIFLKRDRLERIGILAAIAYALITYLQWRDLRHNFMIDQRPWVGLDKSQPFIQAGQAAKFVFEIKNYGKTPAMDLSAKIFDYSTSAFQGDGSEPTPFGPYPPPIRLAGVLFPAAIQHLTVQVGPPLSQALIDQTLKTGDQEVFVYVVLTYKDTFGREHTTRICDAVSGDLSVSRPCQGYNTAN